MPSHVASQAKPVVNDLLQQDPDQLYAELGARMQAIQNNPALAGSFAPQMPGGGLGLAPMDTLRTFGKSLFENVSVQAYAVICGTNATDQKQRDDLLNAFTQGSAGVGAIVAGALVTQLAIAPAVATVVAALIMKLFFHPAYEAMCTAWKASLPGAQAPSPAAG